MRDGSRTRRTLADLGEVAPGHRTGRLPWRGGMAPGSGAIPITQGEVVVGCKGAALPCGE